MRGHTRHHSTIDEIYLEYEHQYILFVLIERFSSVSIPLILGSKLRVLRGSSPLES
eukprot:COSAG03_NODE_14846_length_450_cov_0.669516_1_plen_55_part_10